MHTYMYDMCVQVSWGNSCTSMPKAIDYFDLAASWREVSILLTWWWPWVGAQLVGCWKFSKGQVRSLSQSWQNSRMLSKRHHCSSDDRPFGGITGGCLDQVTTLLLTLIEWYFIPLCLHVPLHTHLLVQTKHSKSGVTFWWPESFSILVPKSGPVIGWKKCASYNLPMTPAEQSCTRVIHNFQHSFSCTGTYTINKTKHQSGET